jgi:phage terminase large subunit-like protein
MNATFPPLHKGQSKIFKEIKESKALYHIVVSGRQFGKTFLGMAFALDAMCNSNQSGFWFSPTYAQAIKVYEEFKKLIKPILRSEERGMLRLTLDNGTTIKFISSGNSDAIHGYSIEFMVVDEFSRIGDKVWDEAIRPTFRVKGKKALLISTPKGRGRFFELFKLGESDNTTYKSYRGNALDNPFLNQSETEDAKKTLPVAIYEEQYEGKFNETGGEVFSNLYASAVIEKWQEPIQGMQYYAGIDLGRQEDYTVLTILNQLGETVYIYRDRQQDWGVMIDKIVSTLHKYKPNRTIVESNSIGDVVYDMIKKKYSFNLSAEFTGTNKQSLIESLILAFNNSVITIPRKELFDQMYKELEVFTYSYNSKTRNISYAAPKGFHDDCVMSLAIAYKAFMNKIQPLTVLVR